MDDNDDDAPDVEELADLVASRGWTVGTAESLTSGNVATELGRAPEASRWFRGAVVAYGTEVKVGALGVTPGPVVTRRTALEMARGAADLLRGRPRGLAHRRRRARARRGRGAGDGLVRVRVARRRALLAPGLRRRPGRGRAGRHGVRAAGAAAGPDATRRRSRRTRTRWAPGRTDPDRGDIADLPTGAPARLYPGAAMDVPHHRVAPAPATGAPVALACRAVVDDLAARGIGCATYLLLDGRLRCTAANGLVTVLDGFVPPDGDAGRAVATGQTVVGHRRGVRARPDRRELGGRGARRRHRDRRGRRDARRRGRGVRTGRGGVGRRRCPGGVRRSAPRAPRPGAGGRAGPRAAAPAGRGGRDPARRRRRARRSPTSRPPAPGA